MPRTRLPSALSREKIEAEALALIEAQGLDAFSTRKLGERLGVEAMSIYHHFPSKAHLLDALVNRTLSSLPLPPRELAPAQRIRRLAQAWRAMSRQTPRFYLWMALHRWNGTASTRPVCRPSKPHEAFVCWATTFWAPHSKKPAATPKAPARLSPCRKKMCSAYIPTSPKPPHFSAPNISTPHSS
jgi:AcrR family transcriptional regulator